MKKKQKILLIVPPVTQIKVRKGENLGIKYIASYLELNNYKCDILESNVEEYTIENIIEISKDYDVIGLSLNFTYQYYSTSIIITEIKKNNSNIHIIVGGHFATIKYEYILMNTHVDVVILGDGEITFYDLVRKNFENLSSINNIAYLKNNTIVKTGIQQIKDIDTLPFPKRDKNSFFMNEKHFSIITSRGCPGSCSFCSVSNFYKNIECYKWRLRSAKNVVDEIEYLYNKYQVNVFSIIDNSFLNTSDTSKKRVIEFCNLIESKKLNISFNLECKSTAIDIDLFSRLKEVGLKNVYLGIESGNQRGLDLFNKELSVSDNENAINILRQLDIDISIGFINFYPEVRIKDLIDNLNFLYKNKLLYSHLFYTKLVIYHGTDYSKRNLNEFIDLTDDNININYKFKNEKLEIIYELLSQVNMEFLNIENDILRTNFLLDTRNINNKEMIRKSLNEIIAKYQKLLYITYKEIINKNSINLDFKDTLPILHNEIKVMLNSFHE